MAPFLLQKIDDEHGAQLHGRLGSLSASFFLATFMGANPPQTQKWNGLQLSGDWHVPQIPGLREARWC